MIPQLDTPERVHYAMLQGTLPRITLMQCAHTWGAKSVLELQNADHLRADLKAVSETLCEYRGKSPLEQVEAVLAEVTWLRNELTLSQKNEYAAQYVLRQDQAELVALRSKMRHARIVMEANDPHNARFLFGPTHEGDANEQEARQASGSQGPQQERTDEQTQGAHAR